jgi:putative aldouronate transport system permease protein
LKPVPKIEVLGQPCRAENRKGRAFMMRVAAAKKKPSALWQAVLKHKYFYIMLVPVAAWYIIFCYVPMYGVLIAFQDYAMTRGVLGSPWVGFTHFKNMMADRLFWRAFRNSVILAGMRLLFEFPVPIIISILINELRQSWLRKVTQTVMYLPHFLSWITVASIIITFINPDKGLIAVIYTTLGSEMPPNIITNNTFRGLMIVSNLWKEAGWGMIIYLAAMSGIDATLYEAAYADGANRFQRVWHVTIPAIRSVIVVMLILQAGSMLTTGFDQVFNMSNKLVMDTADIIDFYVYRVVMNDFRLSYAGAIGLFNSIICAALLLGSNALAKVMDTERIY